MMMTNETDDLNAYFDAARRAMPAPSADFMARMTAEALAHQPAPKARYPMPSAGVLSQLLAGLGGWPAVAGLTSAAVAGLWIGAAPPAALSDTMLNLVYGVDAPLVDPVSGFDFVLLEG